MSTRLFALAFALSLPATTPVIAADPKPPEVVSGDPKEKICETVTMIGSRLAKKRICATRAEWADQRRQDRQAIEKAQTSPCVLQSTGATGKPSC